MGINMLIVAKKTMKWLIFVTTAIHSQIFVNSHIVHIKQFNSVYFPNGSSTAGIAYSPITTLSWINEWMIVIFVF